MSPVVFSFFFKLIPGPASDYPRGAGWLLPVCLSRSANYPQGAWVLWPAPSTSEQSVSAGVPVLGRGLPL